MATSLTGLLEKPMDMYTLTPKYKAHIDSMRLLIRGREDTQAVQIDPELGNVYRGNLTGLLLELRIRREDHFIVMNVNDILSIHDCDADLGMLFIPSQIAMDQMKAIYRQSLNKR